MGPLDEGELGMQLPQRGQRRRIERQTRLLGRLRQMEDLFAERNDQVGRQLRVQAPDVRREGPCRMDGRGVGVLGKRAQHAGLEHIGDMDLVAGIPQRAAEVERDRRPAAGDQDAAHVTARTWRRLGKSSAGS